MTGKIGAAIVVLIGLLGTAGAADIGPDPRRAGWREAYRAPAAIPFPDENPYTPAKATLGRKLFFDPILSGDGTRSCASCHLPDLAWGDGRARAPARGQGDMEFRSPTILNLAWVDGPLGWDGKFRDIEGVAHTPITAPGNMNLPMPDALARLAADRTYAAAFASAFDDPAVTRDRLEAALATFQRTVVSGTSPFDRWIAGEDAAIAEPAKRGFDLFNGRAGCTGCHTGWALTDGSFHDVGVGRADDIGRGRIVPSSPALRYAFKTPTLREVARRAPYMHDGSLPTLEAVIDLYDRGGIDRPSRSRAIRPLRLTAQERADLLAFLKTLSTASERDAVAAVPGGGVPTR